MKWLLILSVLIACTGTSVSSSCIVELSPSAVVVRFGDPLSVNCSSPSNQTVSMGWESIYETDGLQEGVSSVSLKVNTVKHWEVGPICFMNFENGSQCSETLPVTVYKLPDSVSMSQLRQTGPMVEGVKYQMKCDVVNVAPVRHLSVHWHKGDKIIYTDKSAMSSRSPVNTSSLFTLTAERGDNGAPIWCEAKLDFSPPVPNMPVVQSKPREVTVLYSPTFIKPENETLEISGRNKIILDCTATGNPMPVYSWHLPHPIQQTKSNQDENQPILSPSIELAGTYSCTASNTQGTKTKYFNVVEAPRDRTTLAALVGGFAAAGFLFLISGVFFVTREGTFSCCKGSYLKGQPTSSGPV